MSASPLRPTAARTVPGLALERVVPRPPAARGDGAPAGAPDRGLGGPALPTQDPDLARLAARASFWRRQQAAGAPPADVELSLRVLADGGRIAVARQVVDGRTLHIDAIVR